MLRQVSMFIENLPPQKDKEYKILLVDDQAYNLTALKIILEHHAKVDVQNICNEAGNGKEALLAVQKNVA